MIKFAEISHSGRNKPKSLLDSYSGLLGVAVPRREAELALRIAMRDAEAANRAKSDFLANMSHELRTPLNAILGFSEVIQTSLSAKLPPEKIEEYASDIYASGRHLLSLIDRVLDLSKVEAGQMELNLETIAISQVIEAVLRMLREQIAEDKLELIVDIQNTLPDLKADEVRLKQVLLNLLSNAVKFTEEGGRIAVISYVDEHKNLQIEIVDNGIGMSPEDIPGALTPFQQIEACLTKTYEGTGLGLPIAKAMTELMGGAFNINSVRGKGTKVTLTFFNEIHFLTPLPRESNHYES